MSPDDDVLIAVSNRNVQQFIALTQRDGFQAVLSNVSEFRHGSTLDYALNSCKEQEVRIVAFFRINVDDRLNLFSFRQVQQVDDRNSLGSPPVLRNFIALHAIDFADVRKEQNLIVRRSRNQMFDEIVIVNAHPLNAATAATLCLEIARWQPLDVAVVRQCDHDVFFFDQVFVFNAQNFADHQLGSAIITKFFLNFKQFLINNAVDALFMRQNIFKISNCFQSFLVFGIDFFTFQSCQANKSHVQNGLSLLVREFILVHQAILGYFAALRISDDADDRIDMVKRNFQAFQNMCSCLRFFQVKCSPATNDVLLMLQVILQNLL